MTDAATATTSRPDQAFTSIVDSLQAPDLDPRAAMAGANAIIHFG